MWLLPITAMKKLFFLRTVTMLLAAEALGAIAGFLFGFSLIFQSLNPTKFKRYLFPNLYVNILSSKYLLILYWNTWRSWTYLKRLSFPLCELCQKIKLSLLVFFYMFVLFSLGCDFLLFDPLAITLRYTYSLKSILSHKLSAWNIDTIYSQLTTMTTLRPKKRRKKNKQLILMF